MLRNAVWAYGTATAGARPLPDFLIVGAQKAGTTALYDYLYRHPAISGPPLEGGQLLRPALEPRRALVPRATSRGMRAPPVGEASPSYLFHPLAPERVRSLVPRARLIALLRNPVDRAFSHYQHEVALGREPLAFEQALGREAERTRGELERMLASRSTSATPGGTTPTRRGGSMQSSSSAGSPPSRGSSCS